MRPRPRYMTSMLYGLFFLMILAFAAAFLIVPAIAAAHLPWWGTALVVVAELIVLRYTLFRFLGFCFATFVWVGLRLGTAGMRGTTVVVHAVDVVPPPEPGAIARRESGSVDEEPDETLELDPPGTRSVRVELTVTPPARLETSNWPIKHYDAGSFHLTSQRFAWPTFPPAEDASRTAHLAAAAVVDEGIATPIAADAQLRGRQRLALTFKVPPTLRGRASLTFVVLKLAEVALPE